jgi:hypothetical protein
LATISAVVSSFVEAELNAATDAALGSLVLEPVVGPSWLLGYTPGKHASTRISHIHSAMISAKKTKQKQKLKK